MNTYNIYSEEEPICVLYHAVARDEEQVKELAKAEGINIEGLVIDLERTNVKNELGRDYAPTIKEALIH